MGTVSVEVKFAVKHHQLATLSKVKKFEKGMKISPKLLRTLYQCVKTDSMESCVLGWFQ